MNLWKLITFDTEVRLYGDVASVEMAERLKTLTAPRCSYGRSERSKPMRGTVAVVDGFLRWPLNEYRFMSPRILRFDLIDTPGGSVLTGHLRIAKPLIFGILAWLGLGVVFQVFLLVQRLRFGSGLNSLGQDIGAIGIAIGMASAYLWICVTIGKHRDRTLIRLLRIVLASEVGARTAQQLLTLSSSDASFIDKPAS